MITISLCMIVKNEEQTLERCLRSVAGVPDEIVIVDTGSDDRTKDIAGALASRVEDFEWIDDFSAARNYSFSHATADYILWLDADDVLLPQYRTKLLQLKSTLSPTVDAVSMMYHYSFDDSGNITQTARRLRLVKRSKNFRWEGLVHEDLVSKDPYQYFDSDIVVTHQKQNTGISLRNLQIYERHLRAGRSLRALDYFQYAYELEVVNKDFENAIPNYQKFLDSKDAAADLNMTLVTLNRIARCYYLTGKPDKEWECTLKSLELDVPRPEFSCRVAERFVQREQFRQAIFWYELAIQDPANTGVNDRVVQNYPFKTWLPHKQLGLCYYRIGDYQRSLRHNELAQQYLPDDADIATNVRLLQRLVKEAAEKP